MLKTKAKSCTDSYQNQMSEPSSESDSQQNIFSDESREIQVSKPLKREAQQNAQNNVYFKHFKRNATSKGSSSYQMDPMDFIYIQETRKSTPYERFKTWLVMLEKQIKKQALSDNFMKQVRSMQDAFERLSKNVQSSIEAQRDREQKMPYYKEKSRQLEQELKQAKRKLAEAEQLVFDAMKKYKRAFQNKDPQEVQQKWQKLEEKYTSLEQRYQEKVRQLRSQLDNLQRLKRPQQRLQFGLSQWRKCKLRVYSIQLFAESRVTTILDELKEKKKLLQYWRTKLNRIEERLKQSPRLTAMKVEELQADKKTLISNIAIEESECQYLERKMKND